MAHIGPKITCNGCGKEKGTTNHWGMFLLIGQSVIFFPWDTEKYLGYEHVCGQVCAAKILDSVMTNWMGPKEGTLVGSVDDTQGGVQ